MAKTENTLYVRNRRPNRVIFSYAGNRIRLEHRGHREDSWALPSDAENDPTVSRWLKSGILEKISRDSFMRLGSRTVDVAPNEFLASPKVRGKGGGVGMVAADADTTRSLTQLTDKSVQAGADPRPQWAGELMTTEQELEEYQYDTQDASGDTNYPSKHRGDDEARRRQMGY